MTSPAKNSSSQRWIRLRQDLYEQVQSHVKALLGQTSHGLARYQQQYDQEFRRAWKVSTRDKLMASLKSAEIVFMGDFHALAQSQRAQLRILKSLPNPEKVVLAVECIEAHQQNNLDQFIQGKLDEREFLKSVDWKKTWGFPWENYKPLFRWAQKNKLPVKALNLRNDQKTVQTLKARDRFAAEKIAEISLQYPDHQIFVIFGDLHLAKNHLPGETIKRLGSKKTLSIFQNSEKIYFQLLRKEIEHQVDLVQLSKDRFCVLSVPPWVKWQNYLIFLEQFDDKSFQDEMDFTDHVARYIRIISEDLGVEISNDHFSIVSANDSKAWTALQKGLSELDTGVVREWIGNERNFFIPQTAVGYLARSTVNSAAQLAMSIVFANLSGQKKLYGKMPGDFLRLIWLEAVQYFGSKLINPKRKSDTLVDIKAALQARNPSDLGKLALQLALNQRMLELLHLSGSRKTIVQTPVKKKKAYQEAARILGGMLGEKLYHAYRKKLLSRSSLMSLLRKPVDADEFREIYWEILEILEGFPEPFQSKTEKL